MTEMVSVAVTHNISLHYIHCYPISSSFAHLLPPYSTSSLPPLPTSVCRPLDTTGMCTRTPPGRILLVLMPSEATTTRLVCPSVRPPVASASPMWYSFNNSARTLQSSAWLLRLSQVDFLFLKHQS